MSAREVQALLAEAKAWEDARRIWSYVDAVKGRYDRDSSWVQWALGVADRADPATNDSSPPSSLIDRDAERHTHGIDHLALPAGLLGDDD